MGCSHSSFSFTRKDSQYDIRLSIDPFSAKENADTKTKTYKAKAFSRGRFADSYHERTMIAKFLLHPVNVEKSRVFAQSMMDLNDTLTKNAGQCETSNKSLRNVLSMTYDGSRCKIHFQALVMSQLESRWFFDKSRIKGEFFVSEPEIKRRDCEMFLDSERAADAGVTTGGKRGRKPRMACSSRSDLLCASSDEVWPGHMRRPVSVYGENQGDAHFGYKGGDDLPLHGCLETFVHFVFVRERLAIDRLQGIHSDAEGYTLLMPTVHSLAGSFGPGDRGEEGIRRVIKHHRCNRFCRHLRSMTETLEEAINTLDGQVTHPSYRAVDSRRCNRPVA